MKNTIPDHLITLCLLFLILSGCGHSIKKTKVSEDIRSKNNLFVQDSTQLSKNGFPEGTDHRFAQKLITNRINMPDSTRVITLIESDFFNESISDEKYYIFLFNHLIHHDNEGYDGALSYYAYTMFCHYPDKFKQLDYYLTQSDEKEIIMQAIVTYLIFEYLQDEKINNQSETDFFKRFSYFKDKKYKHIYAQGALRFSAQVHLRF